MAQTQKKDNQQGFTLIEILLVIAVIAILAGATTFTYRFFIVKNNLNTTRDSLIQTIRRAQILSQSGQGDSRWGVHITNSEITLYKGQNYSTRDSSADEVYNIPNTLSASSLNDINFAKVSGEALNTGTITLSSDTSETENITINKIGTIDY